MATAIHTYGPTCHFERPEPSTGDDAPRLNVQYFYSSSLPIDDPLSVVPTPVDADSRNPKHPPRPFSTYDNNALENAWRSLVSMQDRKYHDKIRAANLKPLTKAQILRRATIVKELTVKHTLKHSIAAAIQEEYHTGDESTEPEPERRESGRKASDVAGSKATAMGVGCDNCDDCEDDTCGVPPQAPSRRPSNKKDRYDVCDDPQHDPPESQDVVVCCPELEYDAKAAQAQLTGVIKRRESRAHQEMLIRDVMSQQKKRRSVSHAVIPQGDATADNVRKVLKFAHKGNPASPESTTAETVSQSDQDGHRQEQGLQRTQHNKEPAKIPEPQLQATPEHHEEKDPSPAQSPKAVAAAPPDTGLTHAPFIRAVSRRKEPVTFQPDVEVFGGSDRQDGPQESVQVHRCKAHNPHKLDPEVPVGVSRLHLVKLPALHMTPIYWSPVHDVAAVTRGTWFYKDTMLPVEPPVANQLEAGYRELQPWSQTWADQLTSAITVGAEGEEKIAHRLWPKDFSRTSMDRSYGLGDPSDSNVDWPTSQYCAARCFHSEVSAVGTLDAPKLNEKVPTTTEIIKKYPNSQVIYKDAMHAFILKPSLQPSQYFGRRPLSKIFKNVQVGIAVVRGFDWQAWEKLHPPRKTIADKSGEKLAAAAETVAIDARTLSHGACPACRQNENRPPVTDLVLVVHGIGQKLSERMESFHFTHAINAFRRSVNVELGNEKVKKMLRPELGGVMVLPVNWRSNLTFEEGGPSQSDADPKTTNPEEFSLKDITPDTIPAVRNLISDVLLDIPYYLSHHKAKMIEALIAEANRVFRLWCKNNPDFRKCGRVHLIAHSLGSAMALDVLSKQPTSVGAVNVSSRKMQKKYFEFNTTNLFFAGSPAAFFLLLDKGKLLPRRGRNKPDVDAVDDTSESLTGQAGTYGCLAIDNLYNVMHYNDPIAYRLNATVDPMYAASLKAAELPVATASWMETVGNAIRTFTPGAHPPKDEPIGQLAPVKPLTNRLPSQLEMEIHDFSREEMAERRFHLLNDNGQIDYFLVRDGGPLEIQYLNMLGAHSSYWTSPDFVRMIVTEVGRKPGKTNAMPNMKAIKAGHKPKKSGR